MSRWTTGRSTWRRLEPFTARADGGPIIAYTLPITVPLKGSAALRVHYSQRLTEQGGLVSYTYPITATARWSGTPESLRMTLKFSPPLPADQVVSQVPAARRTERDGFTWHWDGQRPKASIGVAFMSPTWWRDFAAARAAAAAPAAGLAEHLALSRFYRHLSELPPPAFDAAADFYGRNFPSESRRTAGRPGRVRAERTSRARRYPPAVGGDLAGARRTVGQRLRTAPTCNQPRPSWRPPARSTTRTPVSGRRRQAVCSVGRGRRRTRRPNDRRTTPRPRRRSRTRPAAPRRRRRWRRQRHWNAPPQRWSEAI